MPARQRDRDLDRKGYVLGQAVYWMPCLELSIFASWGLRDAQESAGGGDFVPVANGGGSGLGRVEVGEGRAHQSRRGSSTSARFVIYVAVAEAPHQRVTTLLNRTRQPTS
jgi:hypothetical protein